jgi:hypothetical protein
LLSIVLETQKFITVLVEVSAELVLDALPGRDVSRVLISVLPDGAPRLEYVTRRGVSDLGRAGEPGLHEAPDHQGMGLGVEGVELGRDVGLRADVERRGFHVGNRARVRVGNVVVFGRGVSRGRGGGGRAEQVDFREREQGVDDVVVLREGNGRLGLDDRGRWWAQIMMVEVVVEMVVVIEEIFFCFVGIHGIEVLKKKKKKRIRGWVGYVENLLLLTHSLFLLLFYVFQSSFSLYDVSSLFLSF